MIELLSCRAEATEIGKGYFKYTKVWYMLKVTHE